jgi:hypothetical protein
MKALNVQILFALLLFGFVIELLCSTIVPSSVEMIFRFIAFVACAVIIAKAATGNYFLHGFILSFVYTMLLPVFYQIEIIVLNLPKFSLFQGSDKISLMVTISVTLVGALITGLFLGLFSFIAAKLFARK